MQKIVHSAPDGFRLSPESKDNGKETRKAHEARRLQEGRQEGRLLMKRRNLFGLLAASAAAPLARLAPAAEPVVDIHRDTVDGIPALARFDQDRWTFVADTTKDYWTAINDVDVWRLEYAGEPAKL